MQKARRLNENQPRVYQWITDGGELEALECGSHNRIFVEVQNNETGEEIKFFGSLHGEPKSLIGYVRQVNDMIELPPVRFLLPVAPAGVTINFMGVQ